MHLYRLRALLPALATLTLLLGALGAPATAHAGGAPTLEVAPWPEACSGVTITGFDFQPDKGIVILAREEHSHSAFEIPNGRPAIGDSGTFEVQFTFPQTCDPQTAYLFSAATLSNGKLGLPLTEDVRYAPAEIPLPANAGTGPTSKAPLPTTTLALLALAATLLLTAGARRATAPDRPR